MTRIEKLKLNVVQDSIKQLLLEAILSSVKNRDVSTDDCTKDKEIGKIECYLFCLNLFLYEKNLEKCNDRFKKFNHILTKISDDKNIKLLGVISAFQDCIHLIDTISIKP